MENPTAPAPKGPNGGQSSSKPALKVAAKSGAKTPPAVPAPVSEPIPVHVAPLFRKIDWLAFFVTSLLVFIGYYLTLSPNLGLEDSGELAVASQYAGIPHPPGYPVWTLYTWVFTVILPFSNMAWRVAVGSAFAGAVSCGMLALLVSRGSSMMMEGIAGLKEIGRRWESAICIVTGFIAGLLLGFNGYMWSQSVIVEVYSSCVLSLMFVLLGLIRWTYAPHQFRYLYLAFFSYGICINNHQSLLVIALGMEVWVLAVQRKLARQLLFWNTICWLAGLVAGSMGYFTTLTGNPIVFIIFNLIGIGSAAGWIWLAVSSKIKSMEITRDLVLLGVIGAAAISFLAITGYISRLRTSGAAQVFFALLAIGGAAYFYNLYRQTRTQSREWLVALLCGGAFFVGAAFYLYMPLAGATNPPMQWGYPRTVEGFFHALTRGQYEKIKPTEGVGTGIEYVSSLVSTYTRQVWLYLDGTADEFNWAFLLVALIVFVFAWRMQKRERAIVIGMAAIFATLGPFLIFLLNPPPDRQARELIRVFFTASHVLIAMGVGAGLSLIAANLATNYQALRRAAIIGGVIAIDIAIYALAVNTHSLLGEPRGDAAALEALRLAASLKWLGTICIFIFMASAAIITYRLYFSTTDPKTDLAGLICLGIIGFGGLGFGLELLKLKNGQSPGVEFTSLVGFTKAGCWMFGAACLYLASRATAATADVVANRRVPLISGIVASVVSIVLTVVVMRGDTAGIGGFFTALGKAFNPGQYALPVFANLILFATAVVLTLAFVVWRQRAPLGILLLAFLVMPAHSIMSHWFENEQRGHLFGYWFGHDMFTPPFTGKDGKFGNYNLEERKELMKDPEKAKFIYPEMTRDAILYGGTDPGRFCPTYMIFCESFTPPDCKKDTDPAYDRRDVYIITQNALADGTYLNYIRAHYNKSEQIKYDSPFFQELLRGPDERDPAKGNYYTNFIARIAGSLLDGPLNKIGTSIEARRRREGVYPMKEMYIATPDDSQRCFKEYIDDATIRMQRNQLRPGEEVRVVDNKVQVSGQVAVMAINGLLTKVMFDKNPTNEFFVEESFPLDWMFPHLTPFGVIMKINRQPLPSLSEEIMARDHEFWSRYSERLIGNWITYDTPVKEIVDFAEKTYLRRDFSNYKGDRKFARDDQAQKAFSKLRSSIGGIYTWRLNQDPRICPLEFRPKSPAETLRIYKEADFTFRQAFAFCPYSPEAVFRYINLLIQPPPHPELAPRLDDALLVARTCQKLDPNNGQVGALIRQLEEYKKNAASIDQARGALMQLQATVNKNPSNFEAVFQLASAYMQLQQNGPAMALMDQTLQNPAITSDIVLAIASFYARSQNWVKLEAALERLTKIAPDSPEAWYELARFKGAFGKAPDALNAIGQSISLSRIRRATNPTTRDYALEARGDTNFASLRGLPEFQKLVNPQ